MEKLQCPHCGSIFKVDESSYAALLNQVRNKTLEQELERRLNEVQKRLEAEAETRLQKAQTEQERLLQEKTQRVALLEQQLQQLEQRKDAEMQATLLSTQHKLAQQLQQKEQEILQLRHQQELEIRNVKEQQQTLVSSLTTQVTKLESEKALDRSQSEMQVTALRIQHDLEKKELQAQVDYYKDLKVKLSTKMLGESLEEHCRIEYEQKLRPFLPLAYFEKDNEVLEGSKGDFIFRDQSSEGVEYLSIMFEMKHEADESEHKHKIEDFYKKLDRDRTKKGCEYAVLVTTLEADNELYKSGIYPVYQYDKMYVVRPQFFVPIISLLVQSARRSLQYIQELAEAKNQAIDLTNFENDLADFKDRFGRSFKLAGDRYQDAIKGIDRTIEQLQSIKTNLQTSEKHFIAAHNKLDDFKVSTLTRKNPTIKALLEEARKAKNNT